MPILLLLRRRIWGRRLDVRFLPFWLVAIFVAHVTAMIRLEHLSLSDAIWVTATTITTVGYGDVSAHTDAGRLATILLLYVGGIFVLATAINASLEAQQQRLERKRRGEWRWKLKDHIVFMSPRTGLHEEFVEKVVRELREGGDHRHALLLSVGASDRTRAVFEQLDIAVVRTDALNPVAITCADVAHASVVIALDDEGEPSSAFQIDAVSQARYVNEKAHVICEVAAEHADRARHLGATSVVRRTRGYPAMLAREILAPRSSSVIEELFSSHGATLVRIDMPHTILGPWRRIMDRATEIYFGIPIAYEDTAGAIVSCPKPRSVVMARALYVVTDDRPSTRKAKAAKFAPASGIRAMA